MSQQNVQAFTQVIEAVNRGEVEGVLHIADDDIVMLAARSPVEGPYRGHDGLRAWFADNVESFEVFRVDIRELRDLGDQVLAIGTMHIRGRGSGVETDITTAGIASFAQGKLTKWEEFRERALALKAVGLSD
ncbi:MAG TPA: nuclear transport factor 2 family protein [Solirubrobacteraceae bacterium]|jgi:ketosteroid isomerase-like protein|nr:nuclear transport factor 2 family protein [Solirubrobacteraceae bacterium]